MITDIVTNLSVRDGGKPAGDYAVSVASMLDAHVTGIAIAFDPRIPTSALGYLPVDIADEQRRDNETAARAAMERFSEASARACVASEPRLVSTTLADAGKEFGRFARRSISPLSIRPNPTAARWMPVFRKARCSSPAGRSTSMRSPLCPSME